MHDEESESGFRVVAFTDESRFMVLSHSIIRRAAIESGMETIRSMNPSAQKSIVRVVVQLNLPRELGGTGRWRTMSQLPFRGMLIAQQAQGVTE